MQLIHVDIHLILPCHATTIALQCRTRHSSVRKISDTGVSSVSSVGNFGPHFSVSVGSHWHYHLHCLLVGLPWPRVAVVRGVVRGDLKRVNRVQDLLLLWL